MDRKPELERELLELFSAFSAKIEIAKEAYQLSVCHGSKRAEVVWPYPLHEVYFDLWDGQSKVLSESFEFYEGEPDSELVEYLGVVLDRFFNHPTRVQVQGRLLKRKDLQYQQGGVWCSIF
jgi:hypothetical protein